MQKRRHRTRATSGCEIRGSILFIRGAALLAVAAATAPLYAVNVSVDIGNVRAVMPLEGLGMGTAVYDNQFGNANLASRLNEAGVTTLRYSGGGYADIYHWSIHQDSPFGGGTRQRLCRLGYKFPRPAQHHEQHGRRSGRDYGQLRLGA